MIDNEAAVTPGRDERLRKGFVVPDGRQRDSLAARRRRFCRREEWAEQTKLARMLPSYLDRGCTCWTALENKPRSLLGGLAQRRQGVKSGVADVEVIQRQPARQLVVFVELKSRGGVASKTQKQFRLEALAAGCTWWMARSANAAMMALHLSGVQFCRPWEAPPLQPWEGPFADPHQRLPQHPEVKARRRAEQRRYRERECARKAAKIAGLSSGEGASQSPSTGAAP
jgi:hypothetical protein